MADDAVSPAPACEPAACGPADCGPVPDGCGGAIVCPCPPVAVPLKTPVCDPIACEPFHCGETGDGCGRTMTCPCPPSILERWFGIRLGSGDAGGIAGPLALALLAIVVGAVVAGWLRRRTRA